MKECTAERAIPMIILGAILSLSCDSASLKKKIDELAAHRAPAAAAGGLKGNAAFDAAFDALTAELKAEGKELATNVKDTLIQNAYCVFRNTVMPASQPAPKAIEA